jgi:hypothetical protein
LQNGDAYIVRCKHHNNAKKKCKFNSTNCALHCHGHKLIKEASLANVQGVVILYIIPEKEDLKPPINDEEPEIVHGK